MSKAAYNKTDAAENGRVKAIMLMIVVATAMIFLSGCGNFLEGHIEWITVHHVVPYVREPTERIIVSGIEDFEDTVVGLINTHTTEAQLVYHHYDGENVEENIQSVIDDILQNNPIGAFAVSQINTDIRRNVANFEIDLEIEYTRSYEEVDSIVNVASERYLRTQLFGAMTSYSESIFIRTRLQLTLDDIEEIVESIYYQNPGRVVMMPFVAVETFPQYGGERIYEIQFGYIESHQLMQRYGQSLYTHIVDIAGRVPGGSDSEVLLSLVEILVDAVSFDAGTAAAISTHGTQHFAATAFGALVSGNAVGEGFAMAFKALSDELGFNNQVVLGYKEDRIHAWNIVYLYGYYYHIDVAMITTLGWEYAFLKTDADFALLEYKWDFYLTPRCEGSLTLDDILAMRAYYEEDEEDEDAEDEIADDVTDDDQNEQGEE